MGSSADYAWIGVVRKEATDDEFYSLYDLDDPLINTNFAVGTDFSASVGECVVVDENGEWFTRPCLQQTKAVICQRDKG